MFNKEQVRQQIIQYFKSVGSGENILQAIKQALFLNQKFSPLLMFQLVSQGKQKITRDDWKRYLQRRNISFSDEQIRYFFRHNHFGQDVTLNQFLEAMIPYNADVIREFKAKYLESLQIRELDPQAQFIFAQLMSNWIGVFRNLIKVRSSLSRSVTRKQIQHLVKQDLILYSKPRQARKFHESFQQYKFQLSFHQLRKFLELWINSKQLLHQFCLLNVKRHIKCENPFQKMVYRHKKLNKSGTRSLSASRSVSKRRSPPSSQKHPLSTQKKYQNNFGPINNPSISKYDQYKKQLRDALKRQIQEENIEEARKQQHIGKQSNRKNYYDYKNSRNIKQQKNEDNFQNEIVLKSMKGPAFSINNNRNQNQNKQFNSSKHKQRMQTSQKKSNPAQIIVKIFQQIILKQDRLQKLRKQLAKSNDFNLINLFKVIDHKNKGFVNSEDIAYFCQGRSAQYSHLIKFYAREAGKLRLQQLSTIFRPLSKQLNDNLDKRPQHKVPNPFKKETSRLIFQIIRLEAEMHNNLENYKKKIRQQGISPKSLFEYVDVDSQGYLTSQSVKDLLEQNNINCEAKDLKCLMKLFNKKVDQKISSKEFLNFIDF